MKLLSVVGALAVMFTTTSCNQDMMEAKYNPDNNNITFESATTKYSLEGQALVVKINRGIAKEAVSIPLTLTDPNGIYTMNKKTADFAEGEYSTEVQLTYDVTELKPVVNYAFTLSFNEAEKAASGTNKITATCQMPLVYQDWGTMSPYSVYITSLLSAEQRNWKIQLADNTNNYFKIVGMYGGQNDLEFNIQNGKAYITAPDPSYYSSLGAYPLAKMVTGAIHPSYGVMTAWIDMDPEYSAFGYLQNGTLAKGSIMQMDVFYTVSAGYFGWKTDQYIVSAVN